MPPDADETRVFHPVTRLDSVNVGVVRGFIVEGWPVLVARLPNGVHAVLDRCSHAAARLSDGRLRRGAVACPVHGGLFDLSTGRCVGDHYRPLLTFSVRVTDGVIEVATPAGSPTPDQLPVGVDRD